VAAAVLLVLYVGVSFRSEVTPNTAARPGVTGTIATIPGSRLVVLDGDVRFSALPANVGDQIVLGSGIETGRGRAVFSLPRGIALSLSDNTRIRIVDRGDPDPEVNLLTGEIIVAVEPRQDRSIFAVVTNQGRIEVTGTTFMVSSNEAAVQVRMFQGEVEIRVPQDVKPRRLTQGRAASLGQSPHSWALSEADLESVRTRIEELTQLGLVANAIAFEPDATSPDGPKKDNRATPRPQQKPSLKELKNRIQQERGQHSWRAAAQTYQTLIKHHPGSDQAKTAIVSLGQLQLEKLNQPEAALKGFERYLSTAGPKPLAQEALFGKIKALGMLGNRSEELKAAEVFIRRYPIAVQVTQVKKRIEELKR
jgi:hypothetical protein